MPVATTENAAFCPGTTVWFCGWVVIVGGRRIVKVAPELVTFPPALVTFTE